MRENDKPPKPWQAIPAPPISHKPAPPPVPAPIPVVKKPAEIPVDRGFAPSGPPEYTAEQVARIKDGIKAGRAAMEKRGVYAMVFTDAFCKAGGLQVPGRPQISDDRLRAVGSIILVWLEGADYSLLKNWRWIDDAITDALHREVNRALQEVFMFGAGKHPGAYAWRFIPSPNSVDKEACQRLAECDNYGLGKGLFPLDEILVFQPIYDRAYLELVYRDEVSPVADSAVIQPVAANSQGGSGGLSVGWLILVGLAMFAIGYLVGHK